jgi:hypothetical protein
MNRNLLLLLFLLVAGGTAYFLYQKKGKQTGSNVSWDMDFTILDTAQITQVFLADRRGNKILLKRGKDYWTLNNTQQRVRPTAIQVLLDCFYKQQVQYIPPEQMRQNMVAQLGSAGIKTEVYMNGSDKPFKVFYVGDVTQDERGTHMMMEGAELPYVVHIPSFVGAVRGRYMVELDDWKDRSVFSENPTQIASISVEYPLQKSASFIVEKKGSTYDVKPFYSTQQTYPASKLRKGIADSYTVQFSRLIAEAFETHNPLRDSVSALIPFCVLTLSKTDGTQRQVKFHPVQVERDRDTGKPYVFRYFANCSWGDFMLVQHTVFGNVFRGYDYFFDVPNAGERRIQ